MTPVPTRWMVAGIVTVIIVVFLSSVFFPAFYLKLGLIPPLMSTSHGFVIIKTAMPQTPDGMPLYLGTLHEGDFLDIGVHYTNDSRTHIVSEEEAPILARSLLEKNGGIPAGISRPYSTINYLYHMSDSGEVLEKIPQETSVSYSRLIGNYPVTGYSDRIHVDFDHNGECRLYKRWRSIEPSGNIKRVIPPNEALIKLSRGEVLDLPMCCEPAFTIEKVQMGYYEKYPTYPTIEDSVITIEPVWILSGTFLGGDPWELSVPARENSTLVT